MAIRSIVFTFGASGNLSGSTFRANQSAPGQPAATVQTVVLSFDDAVSKNRLYKAFDAIENAIIHEFNQSNTQPNAGVPV